MPKPQMPTSDQMRVQEFANAKLESIMALSDRWEDEKDYEDWNDYVTALKGWVPAWALFLSASKRPFGITLQVGEAKVFVGSFGRDQWGWKRVG
jgi:hypothetical protein